MRSIVSIFRIAVWEFRQIVRDQGVLIFILLLPLAYPILYATIYNNEVVNDVPTAVVDDCGSDLSREFIRQFDACQGAHVVQYCTSMAEAQELMCQSRVYGILRIPSSFERDLNRGQQTKVGLYCNMASSLYYKNLALAANGAILSKNKDIMVERHLSTTTSRQRATARQPIAYSHVPLFNTQSGFASFLIPPVLMLILQQTLLLGIGMSMGRARETYRSHVSTYLRLYTHPIYIVLGKGMVYFLLYLLFAVYNYAFITRLFELPALGDYLSFLAFVVPYLLACVFFSIILSCLVYRREDCIMLFVALSVPLLFLSGITWPTSSMPVFWQYVSYLFPSTFGMTGYVKIQSMGASLSDVSREYHALWAQTAVYFLMAVLLYRWRIGLVYAQLKSKARERK